MFGGKKNPDGTNTTLFEGGKTRALGELLNAAIPNSQYGNQFILAILYDDGTSNGPQYCWNLEQFTVIDNRQETILVEEIILTPSAATLTKGEQLQFTATVLPANATYPNLTWSSSYEWVASVDEAGMVSALHSGVTTIRATAKDGSGVFGEAIIAVVAPSYTLTFSASKGGSLIASVDGEDITSPALLEDGTVVTFVAIPESNYVLEAWVIDGIVVDSISSTIYLEIDKDYKVFVSFRQKAGIEELLFLDNTSISFDTCYAANKTIYVGGNWYVVEENAIVKFEAGQNIIISPGTHFKEGSMVHARIVTDGIFCDQPLKAATDTQPTDPSLRSVINFPENKDVSSDAFNVLVYPNPTNASITLVLSEPAVNAMIEVYGLLGERVLTKEISGSSLYELELSSQPQGIYLVKISNGNSVVLKKIIKN